MKKKINKQRQGKINRRRGAVFEREVRADLEKEGWIVCKWANNVEDGKIIPAKHKFNPFLKVMTMGTGFPDFIVYKAVGIPGETIHFSPEVYSIVGIECKSRGYLDEEEKKKCRFYLDNHIFSNILIARKDGKTIKYVEFEGAIR